MISKRKKALAAEFYTLKRIDNSRLVRRVDVKHGCCTLLGWKGWHPCRRRSIRTLLGSRCRVGFEVFGQIENPVKGQARQPTPSSKRRP